MSTLEYLRHQLVFIVPFTLVQIAMAVTLIRWARRRLPLWGVAAAWVLTGIAAVFELVTILLDTFSWFWKIFRVVGPHYSWMRTATYVWISPSSIAFFGFLVYRFLLNRSPIEVNPTRRKFIHAAGLTAIAAPFAVEAYGAFVNRVDFRIREIDLKVKDLHPDLEGLRILQLSDVHLSPYLSVKEFARVIDASNELRPQVTAMTGDLISSWGDPLDACLAQLKRVRSDAGMLGCMGNHEAYTLCEDYVAKNGALLGIGFLRRENRQLRFGNAVVNFAGIDYRPFKMRGRYLPGVASLKSPGALNILLSHNPDVFPEAAAQGWDVTLAGHTHGGQVTVEILEQTLNPARFYTRYVSGLYRQGDSQCYVTRGIGTIGIPARLGALPEITLLRLRKA